MKGWGGKRPGQGRKKKYEEVTKCLTVSLPAGMIASLDSEARAKGLSRSEVIYNRLRRARMKITVTQNSFHGGDYPEVYYEGYSERQAIRAARKHACIECQCGGPRIEREDGAVLLFWEAGKPFVERGEEPTWDWDML